MTEDAKQKATKALAGVTNESNGITIEQAYVVLKEFAANESLALDEASDVNDTDGNLDSRGTLPDIKAQTSDIKQQSIKFAIEKAISESEQLCDSTLQEAINPDSTKEIQDSLYSLLVKSQLPADFLSIKLIERLEELSAQADKELAQAKRARKILDILLAEAHAVFEEDIKSTIKSSMQPKL